MSRDASNISLLADLTRFSRCSKAKRSLVHFFHNDFRRCKIMDRHLEVSRVVACRRIIAEIELAPSLPLQKLAEKHVGTLFLRVNVANVPFLVTKLEIKVLPCVVGFVEGLSKLK